jgi:hypothetical protein
LKASLCSCRQRNHLQQSALLALNLLDTSQVPIGYSKYTQDAAIIAAII